MDTLPNIAGLSEESGGATETARVIENQLGDGYRQRAADGINAVNTDWEAVWKDIPDADAETLVAFFRAKGGYEAFYFTPPRKTAAWKWTCAKWTDRPATCGLRTVSATFRREFDV